MERLKERKLHEGSISTTLGIKRKCAGRHRLAQKDAIQFHQQNCAQLHWCIGLEVTPNFHAVCSAPYASMFRVNLLAQKLLVKWWRNWPKDVSSSFHRSWHQMHFSIFFRNESKIRFSRICLTSSDQYLQKRLFWLEIIFFQYCYNWSCAQKSH